jgi:hypothetical protein
MEKRFLTPLETVRAIVANGRRVYEVDPGMKRKQI